MSIFAALGYSIAVIDECHPHVQSAFPGHTLRYLPDILPEDVVKEVKDAEVLLLRSKLKLSKEVLCQLPNLKVIARLGSGLDGVDTAYAAERKITCFNAPEGNRNAVAEHAVGLIISVLSKINEADRQVRNGIWDRKHNTGEELAHQTVAILGFGNAGSRLAELLQPFGCEVLAYDPQVRVNPSLARQSSLKEIQKNASILCFHPNLNDTSFYLFNDDFLEAMERPFYLFNLSRGKVCSLQSILKGLRSGELLGCGLDVLENEVLSSYSAEEQAVFASLTEHQRVVLTPHVAGLTKESYFKLAQVLCEKVNDWLIKNPFLKSN